MSSSLPVPAREDCPLLTRSPRHQKHNAFQSHTWKSDKKRVIRRWPRRRFSSFPLHPGLVNSSYLLVLFLFHHTLLLSWQTTAAATTTDDAGDADSSATPPQFVEEPKPLEYVPLDQSHVLTCSARGSPPLRYRWIKVGAGFVTPASPNGFHRISAMKASDYGAFRCLVANDLGAVLSRESIIIRAKLELKALEGDNVKNETVMGK